MHARRRFLRGALAVLAAGPALAKPAAAPGRPVADFDALWRAIDEGYAYLEPAQDWRSAASRWRPKAAAARTREDLLAALEGALAELNDEHVTLDAHLPGSPRTVPAATDLWAEWIGPDAVISAVRAGSVADVAGAVPGMKVIAVEKTPVEQAVRALLRRGRQSDPRARDWALRRLVAGPWSGTIALEASHAGRARRLGIDRQDLPASETPPLVARRIGEDREPGLPSPEEHAGRGEHRATLRRRAAAPEGHARADPRPARNAVGRLRRRRARAPRAIRDGRLAVDPAHAPGDEARRRRGRRAGLAARALRLRRAHGRARRSLDRGRRANRSPSASRRRPRATLVGTGMAGLRGRRARAAAARLGHRPSLSRRAASSTPTARRARSSRPAVAVDIVRPNGGPGDPILYQALKLLEAGAPRARGVRLSPAPWRPGQPSRAHARRSARGSPPPARGCLRR